MFLQAEKAELPRILDYYKKDLRNCLYGYIDIKKDCSFVWKNQSNGNQQYIKQRIDKLKLATILEQLMVLPPKLK